MADLFANLSDLVHELRCAAGTVLTILGSRLEAQERARVECGPQWLTEFEEQRDSLEPQCACGAGYTSAAECPWCREVGDCICWVGHGDCGGCSGVVGISHEPACGWQWDPSCPQHGDGLKASAASALAADPSPAVRSRSPASVGGEGPGGASDIPQSAPPGQPTVPIRFRVGTSYQPRCGACGCDVAGLFPNQIAAERAVSDKGGRCNACFAYLEPAPVPPVVAGESPREEDEQPSLGEPAEAEDADELAYPFCCYEPAEVTHEDLAAHLIGAAIRANTGHVDVLVEAFASSLLTDFNITKK